MLTYLLGSCRFLFMPVEWGDLSEVKVEHNGWPLNSASRDYTDIAHLEGELGDLNDL